MEMFLERSREPIIAQAFLPAVKNGDKRVILIDGEAVGAINRRPQPGETRSNMHVGGTAEPDTCLLYTSPSPRDATLSRMPSSA